MVLGAVSSQKSWVNHRWKNKTQQDDEFRRISGGSLFLTEFMSDEVSFEQTAVTFFGGTRYLLPGMNADLTEI